MTIITRPWALYNEIDEYAADWLENLIRLGAIAPGIVDRRSIADLRGDDLRGFRQCHFFAGIGVWSYALRRAGVSDDTALWTGSCPCQPFSAAGKGIGVDDERHLWPAFFHLIEAERPPRIYGEQVASKDGLGWLDLVQADLEGSDYSIWAVDTCSAGSGAPHIRQRLRFFAYDLRSATGVMADTDDPRLERRSVDGRRRATERSFGQGSVAHRMASSDDDDGWTDLSQRRPEERTTDGRGSAALRMAYTNGRNASTEGIQRGWEQRQQPQDGGGIDGLADHQRSKRREIGVLGLQQIRGSERARATAELAGSGGHPEYGLPGPTNGFWRDADWVFCRDGKWRPIGPSSQQMADGSTVDLGLGSTFPLIKGEAFKEGSGHPVYEGKSRQGMLKGYGNAIDAEATVDFIEATLELDTIDSVRDCSDAPCQSPLELYTDRRSDIEDLA